MVIAPTSSSSLSIGTIDKSSALRQFDAATACGSPAHVRGSVVIVGDVDDLLRIADATKSRFAHRPVGPRIARSHIQRTQAVRHCSATCVKALAVVQSNRLPNWPRRCGPHFPAWRGTPARARRANCEMTLSTSRGRGLLLQRLAQIIGALAQLVEQPRVLDGDDGLGGEVLHQLDLLVGEWADLLAIDR